VAVIRHEGRKGMFLTRRLIIFFSSFPFLGNFSWGPKSSPSWTFRNKHPHVPLPHMLATPPSRDSGTPKWDNPTAKLNARRVVLGFDGDNFFMIAKFQVRAGGRTRGTVDSRRLVQSTTAIFGPSLDISFGSCSSHCE